MRIAGPATGTEFDGTEAETGDEVEHVLERKVSERYCEDAEFHERFRCWCRLCVAASPRVAVRRSAEPQFRIASAPH
jgi:hypothetical protein